MKRSNLKVEVSYTNITEVTKEGGGEVRGGGVRWEG